MGHDRVIARAYEGEPLERAVVAVGERVIYLAKPELAAAASAHGGGVGFPKEDVFAFDEGAFAALTGQWARQRATDPATWNKLRRCER
jgi:hypothetical protein